jgi:hypothetical protein
MYFPVEDGDNVIEILYARDTSILGNLFAFIVWLLSKTQFTILSRKIIVFQNYGSEFLYKEMFLKL